MSRTLVVRQCSTEFPPPGAPLWGPDDTRPRETLRPTSPHALAGMRIDPPPSLAPAAGTTPALTAAAEPPLEPAGVRVVSHGLCVGPYASGSVVAENPSSGVFVFPMIANPASRRRRTTAESPPR